MATINQLAKRGLERIKNFIFSQSFAKVSTKTWYLYKDFNIKPKKPNSAQRKIAKIKLFKET